MIYVLTGCWPVVVRQFNVCWWRAVAYGRENPAAGPLPVGRTTGKSVGKSDGPVSVLDVIFITVAPHFSTTAITVIVQ